MVNIEKFTIEDVKRAKEFAYKFHGMERCIVISEPKTKHLESVANKVRNKGNLYLILAYLHDILDYAEYTTKNRLITEIKKEFGDYIYNLLVECSDNFKIEDISTPLGQELFTRRIKEIKCPEGVSDPAAAVILAEKVCNLEAMYDEILKTKSKGDYWQDLKDNHGLCKEDVKVFYETIYEIIALRCYNDIRLRGMIDLYDDLMYRIFE